jgi:hypothetical protein
VTRVNRHICLAILLGLLIGHVSVAVHAASHVDAGTSECELCISYGDAAKAITSEPVQGLVPFHGAADRIVATAPWVGQDCTLERQRGPPLQH